MGEVMFYCRGENYKIEYNLLIFHFILELWTFFNFSSLSFINVSLQKLELRQEQSRKTKFLKYFDKWLFDKLFNIKAWYVFN